MAPEQAADQVDQAVNRILRALRSGQSARLPGLGTLLPSGGTDGKGTAGKRWVFRREPHER